MEETFVAYTPGMKTSSAWRPIIDRHPLIVVGALTPLVAGSAFFVRQAYSDVGPPPMNAPLTMTCALLAMVPLAWRLRFLITALALAAAAAFALDVLNVNSALHLSSLPSITAVFSAAAYGGRRRDLACAASITVFNAGLMFNLASGSNFLSAGSTTLLNAIGLLWNLSAFLAAWWCGNTVRSGREQTHGLSDAQSHLQRART